MFIIMLATAPPPAAIAAAATASPPGHFLQSGYDIGQNFTSALAIGAAAIVCTLALLAFYFCRYVSLGSGGGGGDGSGYLSSSTQWSGGGGGGGRGGDGAGHLEKIPVVGASDVAGRIKGGEFCAVCLTDFHQTERLADLPRTNNSSVASDDRLRFLPHCSHCFHCECVDEWLKKNLFCPVCRTSLVAAATAAAGSKSSPIEATPPPPPEQREHRIDVADANADRSRELEQEQAKAVMSDNGSR